ncbi:MAG: MFS transporter [Lachnospiraceae bacterium]|nr:MFS transporter [Lachnospiraceae bacterium]
MKRTMEKASILSLSLMLVSSYSVSTALPDMMNFYKGFSRSRVEQLISISSLAIMCVILLNGWISRYLSERKSIIAGLFLIAAGGCVPVLWQSYPVVFAGRVVLGVGIGLINVHAVNMINERYEGEERASLLGYRAAAEVLGNAVLTLIVGQLLGFGWTKAFLIYFAGLPILFLYLAFVPGKKTIPEEAEDQIKEGGAGTRRLAIYIMSACMGGLFICINSSSTMRIPSLILERGMGTEVESSIVLSAMMIMGIVSGVFFGKLVHLLGGYLRPVMLLTLTVGLALVAFAPGIWLLGIGAMAAGMALNVLVTTVFHRLSGRLSPKEIKTATTMTLVGCNLGASSSSLVMGAIGHISDNIGAPFVVFAAVTALLGLGTIVKAGQRAAAGKIS